MEDNTIQGKQTDMGMQGSTTEKKIKKFPIGLMILALLGIVVIIVAIVIFKNVTSTIPLDKYVVFETSGYNGYGSVKVRVDWEAVEEKYGDKVSYNAKAREDYGGFLNFMTPVDLLADCINVKAEINENMSNGDMITYTWEADEELYEYLDCKISAKGGTYTVSGLEEVATFDAFASLQVSFQGASPDGKISYEYLGDDLRTENFTCSTSSGLNNGDTVTITINKTNMEAFADKYGKLPEKMEQDYVVSGLGEYVKAYSEMGFEYISELKDEAEEVIRTDYAKNSNARSSLGNLEYVGYVFKVAKEESENDGNFNELYLVYSGTVSSSSGRFSKTELYFPVLFSNILGGDSGFCYEACEGVLGSVTLGGYQFAGSYGLWFCYIDHMDKNTEQYSVEAIGDLKKYVGYKLVSKIKDITEYYRYTVFQYDAMDTVEEYVNLNYNGGSMASDIRVIGEYLLTAKDQNIDIENRNRYIVVCAATVSNAYGRFETTTVYFPVGYDGVVKLAKGDCLPTYLEEIIGESTLPNSRYGTKGYVDGAEMYSDIITANKKDYTYEMTDGLKEFGQ